MKYILTTLSAICLFAFTASAQDAKATEILKKLSTKTKSYKTIEATFISTLENKQANLNVEQNGTIKLQGDNFKLDLDDYTIITNGTTTWTYAKSDNEIYIDNNEDVEDASQITPSELFTIWETGFQQQFFKEATIDGVVCNAVKLFPINPEERSFHTIVLYIQKNNPEIKRIDVMGKAGDNYKYVIKKFIPNPTLSPALFTYKDGQFAGADVIDNR
jgi:outer membrane lipoprotein carrier protein